MALFKKNPEEEQLYEPYDSIFRIDESKRMPLPQETQVYFEEEQPFNQVWLWALMGAETLLVLLPMVLMKVGIPIIALAAFVMLLTLVLMGSLKLKTRIDDEGVHFKMNVIHWKEQTIPWSDIGQIYVRTYSPIKEYGGWGVRYGSQGKAYNVKGNFGIQIVKKNGKRVLIGTQQPDEAAISLRKHPLLV